MFRPCRNSPGSRTAQEVLDCTHLKARIVTSVVAVVVVSLALYGACAALVNGSNVTATISILVVFLCIWFHASMGSDLTYWIMYGRNRKVAAAEADVAKARVAAKGQGEDAEVAAKGQAEVASKGQAEVAAKSKAAVWARALQLAKPLVADEGRVVSL